MVKSHESLRDNYEVTGIELDTLVDLALLQKGVLGSRMTGAGFGGCTVSLVKEDLIEDFIGYVSEGYTKKTGLSGSFYVTEPADGAHQILQW